MFEIYHASDICGYRAFLHELPYGIFIEAKHSLKQNPIGFYGAERAIAVLIEHRNGRLLANGMCGKRQIHTLSLAALSGVANIRYGPYLIGDKGDIHFLLPCEFLIRQAVLPFEATSRAALPRHKVFGYSAQSATINRRRYPYESGRLV